MALHPMSHPESTCPGRRGLPLHSRSVPSGDKAGEVSPSHCLSHSQVSRLTRAILGWAWKPGLAGARQGPQEPSLQGGAWLGGGAGEGGCPHSPQTMPAASQGPGAQKDPDARRQAHGSGALPQDKQRKSYLGLKVKDEMSPEEDSCLHKNSDNSACDPALCPEAEARERAPNAGPTASRAHAVS